MAFILSFLPPRSLALGEAMSQAAVQRSHGEELGPPANPDDSLTQCWPPPNADHTHLWAEAPMGEVPGLESGS